MRLIFEEVDREYFLEVILDSEDLAKIQESDGVIEEYYWDDRYITDINVFIRKETPLCRSVKGKKVIKRKHEKYVLNEQ